MECQNYIHILWNLGVNKISTATIKLGELCDLSHNYWDAESLFTHNSLSKSNKTEEEEKEMNRKELIRRMQKYGNRDGDFGNDYTKAIYPYKLNLIGGEVFDKNGIRIPYENYYVKTGQKTFIEKINPTDVTTSGYLLASTTKLFCEELRMTGESINPLSTLRNKLIEYKTKEKLFSDINDKKEMLSRFQYKLEKIKFKLPWNKLKKELIIGEIHLLKIAITKLEIEYDSKYGDEDLISAYAEVESICNVEKLYKEIEEEEYNEDRS